MGDYYDHYLKKDFFWLLADDFESCHYFSSPILSWDAMLKMIGVRFEKTVYTGMTYSL